MYDVVIAGAGPGGCITAKALEGSGLKVCILDRKPRNLIGEKVCGDAIGRHHFDFLNRKIGLDYPSEEVRARIKGIKVFSPDMKTFFTVETRDGGYMVDRLLLGQRLVSGLSEADLMTDAAVTGFKGNDIIVSRGGKSEKIRARIAVDASGTQAVLRRRVNSPFVEKEVDKRDMAVCYREIREYRLEDQEYCHIYLNQGISSGGYIWIFPEGRMTNIGLGAQYPINPKERFLRYIKGKPFGGSRTIHSGSGVVPVRRTIDSLVAMQGGLGFMFVGDSACQANPIHGGGIGQAMTAGYLAGSAIKKAAGDVTLETLWGYNLAWMREHGARNAGLDLFRILLQNLTDDQINFGMGQKLIKEEDLIKTSEGEDLELGAMDMIGRAFKGAFKLNLLKYLQFTAKSMKEMKQLYKNYPLPDGFSEWRSRVRNIYNELHGRLKSG